ncbi:MAG: hypothetical protein KBS85_00385 [Lachnospiraceae bacterium]|nr:hypothetical protein [Candidatus Merdinaster equi]
MKKKSVALIAAAAMLFLCFTGCGSNENKPSEQSVEGGPAITSVVVPESEGVDVDDAKLTDAAKAEEEAKENEAKLTQVALTEEALEAYAAGIDADLAKEEAALTEAAATPIIAGGPTGATGGAGEEEAVGGKKPTPVPTKAPDEITPTPIVGGPAVTPPPAKTPKADAATGSVTIIMYGPDGKKLSGAYMLVDICDEVGNPKQYPGFPVKANGSVTVNYDKTVFNRIKVYSELPAGYYFGDDTGFPISDYNFLTAYLVDGQWYDGAKVSASGLSVYVWPE